MVSLTFVEIHLEDGSFSANLPFSGVTDEPADEQSTGSGDQEAAESEPEDEGGTSKAADGGGPGKGGALLGVLLLLIVAAAVVRYLVGDGDEPDVAIETDDEPIDVTVDADGE